MRTIPAVPDDCPMSPFIADAVEKVVDGDRPWDEPFLGYSV